MPTKPSTMAPMRCTLGRRRTHIAVTAAITTGSPPFIIPATLLATVFSASGNSQKGSAIHTSPRIAMRGQSRRGIASRAPGKNARATAPARDRPKGTTLVSRCSIAMSMRRNDEPQVTASSTDNIHSVAPNRETASCCRIVQTPLCFCGCIIFQLHPQWASILVGRCSAAACPESQS